MTIVNIYNASDFLALNGQVGDFEINLMNDIDFGGANININFSISAMSVFNGNGFKFMNIINTANQSIMNSMTGTIKDITFQNIQFKNIASGSIFTTTSSNAIIRNIKVIGFTFENCTASSIFFKSGLCNVEKLFVDGFNDTLKPKTVSDRSNIITTSAPSISSLTITEVEVINSNLDGYTNVGMIGGSSITTSGQIVIMKDIKLRLSSFWANNTAGPIVSELNMSGNSNVSIENAITHINDLYVRFGSSSGGLFGRLAVIGGGGHITATKNVIYVNDFWSDSVSTTNHNQIGSIGSGVTLTDNHFYQFTDHYNFVGGVKTPISYFSANANFLYPNTNVLNQKTFYESLSFNFTSVWRINEGVDIPFLYFFNPPEAVFDAFIKIGGVWVNIVDGFVKVGGVWRQITEAIKL